MSKKIKKAFILILIISVLIITGTIFYLNWIHSPKYSLIQTVISVQQRDSASFEKYVSLDSVFDKYYDEILLQAKEQRNIPKDNWEEIGQNFADGIAVMLKPTVVNILKRSVIESIENSDDKTPDKEISEDAKEYDINFIKAKEELLNNFKGIQTITFNETKTLAEVTISFVLSGNTVKASLIMRKKDNYWQIIEFKNFTELIKNYQSEVKKK